MNETIITALEDLKAQEITTLDVAALTDVMDTLIIASGTSSRHVKALANTIIEELKKQAIKPIGVEGMEMAEWVLVDYGDTVVHIMLPQTRQFYDLETLWSPTNVIT
ncbi:MAG: ribosome silencing factor [Cellvibrionaceae bacterium]|nr:ribosome silencing factor [Cellvibrionaceae bacterium]